MSLVLAPPEPKELECSCQNVYYSRFWKLMAAYLDFSRVSGLFWLENNQMYQKNPKFELCA
jgi:hypothetical protein